ncbi:Protein of unknown function [Cotesia congregata]|uniref:Uncharacterized protein n=1 Tax=Cotesia congregata TaxID=51543 RepID=A0A8J2GZZ8_COTCN|nr:Protein of unknown function [Cotesia congregata]
MGKTAGNPIYKQKFRNEWLQDIQCKDWIVRKETSPGEFVASCKFCMCVVSKNNKYSDLKNHIETKKHKERQNICSPMRQKTLPVIKKSIEKTKVCEAYISLFIAEHTSIATVDHLGQMMKKAVNDSDTIRDIHLHRTNPYLGSGFELKIIELKEKKAITEQQEKELRERCIKFLIKLVHELRSRLPDNIQILQKTNLLACQNVLKNHQFCKSYTLCCKDRPLLYQTANLTIKKIVLENLKCKKSIPSFRINYCHERLR